MKQGPSGFVDPLEQLELGRVPWVCNMVRRFGRNDPWVKANVLPLALGPREFDYRYVCEPFTFAIPRSMR